MSFSIDTTSAISSCEGSEEPYSNDSTKKKGMSNLNENNIMNP